MAVVDRQAKLSLADRRDVQDVEDVLGVALADARGVGRLPHLRERRAAELLPAEVLLDLLLEGPRHLVAGPLEDANLDHLGVGARAADVDPRLHGLALQDVTGHRRRGDPQVGDVHARRRQTGDDRALDHPARVRRVTARDDAVAAAQRRPERGREPHRGLRRQVDVDEPRGAVAPERRAGGSRLPDDVLVDLRAGLDLLERVDPYPGKDARLGADRDLVADRDTLVHAHVVAEVAAAAEDRTFDDSVAAEVGADVDHAPRDARALAHDHALREHRVRPDRGAVGDPAVGPDECRPLDRLDLVDVDLLAHPDVPAQAEAGDLELHAAVERVEVGLPELVEVPDVLPVAVEDVAVQRAAHLEQEREELLREVVRAVVGHVAQHFGLEHVDARVDRVGEDLAPRGLLEESLHAPVVVGDHDPELERVVDRLEADRHGGALRPVRVDEGAEVDVAQRVAGDHEEGLVEALVREPHGAGGAERLLLDGVVDVDTERLAVAEVRADRLRHEREGDDDLVHPVAPQQVDDVLHARLPDDRHHRLRLVRGERPQARPLPTGHHDRLHAFTSRTALTRYCTPASTASARLIQKHVSAHHVSRSVTSTSTSEA